MKQLNMVRFLAAPALLCAFAGIAQADMVVIQSNNGASTENLGSYTGSITYNPSGANAATLIVSLTNTSPIANGGYITAVAIMHSNNFAGINATLTSSTDADFGNLAALVSGSPFGDYRGGASTGGSWTGGGNPSVGTPVGQSLTLTFSLSGTGIGLMSAADFVGLNDGRQDLVVRFRGFANGGSDKVPGIVPTPGAAAVLGLGGLAASRRRR